MTKIISLFVKRAASLRTAAQNTQPSRSEAHVNTQLQRSHFGSTALRSFDVKTLCDRSCPARPCKYYSRWPESLFQTPTPLLFQNFWIRVRLFFKFENPTPVQTLATIIAPNIITHVFT